MSEVPWIRALHERAAQPPRVARVALHLEAADATIGSIEPALAGRMAVAGLPLRSRGAGWSVVGPADGALERLAQWLHAQGSARRWRGELLAVTDASGRNVARIERSAVRPLGIATFAVHLVGRSPSGDYWVQQRALDKATDPGLWDTLMGGLVTAGESVDETLSRETWEEAGLRVDELRALAPIGRVSVRRPVAEGYMVEHIDAFEATVPDALQPLNQDGEVARFDCIDAATLRERLRADAFTLEAALVLLRSSGCREG